MTNAKPSITVLGHTFSEGDFVTVNGSTYEVEAITTNVLLKGKRSGRKLLVKYTNIDGWELRPSTGLGYYVGAAVTSIGAGQPFVAKPNPYGRRF